MTSTGQQATFAAPSPSAALQKESVHMLPCEVLHSGPANVSSFFTVRPQDATKGSNTTSDPTPSDAQKVEANFRGRGLQGVVAPLPAGFTGIIFQEGKLQEDYVRYWKTEAAFDSMTVWGHDEQPSIAHDSALRAFACMEMAT
ncbi:ribonuclease H2, subunit C, partial [Chytriomyces sp. MP71]